MTSAYLFFARAILITFYVQMTKQYICIPIYKDSIDHWMDREAPLLCWLFLNDWKIEIKRYATLTRNPVSPWTIRLKQRKRPMIRRDWWHYLLFARRDWIKISKTTTKLCFVLTKTSSKKYWSKKKNHSLQKAISIIIWHRRSPTATSMFFFRFQYCR